MRFRHGRAAAAALAAAAVIGLPACSAVLGEEESLLDADTLTVGVKTDQPNLGLEDGSGGITGFDVDVAFYIADRLGFAAEDVEVTGVTSADREEKLISGEVDMVVATYSITPARKTQVTFGGPYYVAKQDVLVRAEDTDVRGVRDLEDRSVCQGEGSYSAVRISEGLGIGIEQREAPSYSACIDALRAGEVDAVSTDNLILAGFLAEEPDAFRFVNNPFTDEKYGVGLPHGDVRACEAVNRAISQMYQDGTAEELLEHWFGGINPQLVVTSVPQFEGCDPT
ncbi:MULTISPECIES: glutamate ABC transporter substrate-binding protein [Nocardiopsis]|uniref:Extracellular solute-binding protein family 3 n=1 Tax=Nocardiopsis dassonvillei (strain ATCC 23218 / DSM 43111 / CIP 107115 / JCM 7437 / KCTC 9190 / NBRC 14626 / NCTC 10488 / NRRL B-5397 / IMRU 509) TaxID=446468 RepID=D7AX19_NOCDD|nr:glutamate ABC transporter substrate-binding protein [Nocardiopsis dassonvillei]ADH69789.1 extracellular solute-binding protein family 3 [Nocardiopsis dassonvillei subsp. dassonvillei DSM 43111]APC37789.1 ABC transporter substrate-binding protein [Nocardiopsis dassonvillei]NKY80199.1 glutamate ABC transporter substrate-binding protein [Nocardiopsis dassonvillei]VEI90301.1 PEB1 [Nocardiopsis dassonvillei]